MPQKRSTAIAILVFAIGVSSLTFLYPNEPIPALSPMAQENNQPVVNPLEPVIPTFIAPVRTEKGRYVEVIESCGAHFDGACVQLRSGPGTDYRAIKSLRKGVVMEVSTTIRNKTGTWYKIRRDPWLRYPERASGAWYVNAAYVRPFGSVAETLVHPATLATTTKRILVDRSDQMLYAYDGETLFMKSKVSTGLKTTPTPRGVFTIYRKTPSRYMQGPIKGISDHYYDLPGVPWNLYFTEDGAVIHGAFWHNDFGKPHSNGCVNLPLDQAEILYDWATVGTKVVVRD